MQLVSNLTHFQKMTRWRRIAPYCWPCYFRKTPSSYLRKSSDNIDLVLYGVGDTSLVILLDHASRCTKPTTGITCVHNGASKSQCPTTQHAWSAAAQEMVGNVGEEPSWCWLIQSLLNTTRWYWSSPYQIQHLVSPWAAVGPHTDRFLQLT